MSLKDKLNKAKDLAQKKIDEAGSIAKIKIEEGLKVLEKAKENIDEKESKALDKLTCTVCGTRPDNKSDTHFYFPEERSVHGRLGLFSSREPDDKKLPVCHSCIVSKRLKKWQCDICGKPVVYGWSSEDLEKDFKDHSIGFEHVCSEECNKKYEFKVGSEEFFKEETSSIRVYRNKNIDLDQLKNKTEDYLIGQLKSDEFSYLNDLDIMIFAADHNVIVYQGESNSLRAAFYQSAGNGLVLRRGMGSGLRDILGGSLFMGVGGAASLELKRLGRGVLSGRRKNAKDTYDREQEIKATEKAEIIARDFDKYIDNEEPKYKSHIPELSEDDLISKIKKLSDLKEAGILTASEFEEKKTDLLKRI